MKTVDLTAASNLSDLLALAAEETILLKTPEGREFVLTELDDFDEEIASIRRNRELLELLDTRSGKSETSSLAEVRRRLGLG
jgi:hypothetical protein